MRGNGIKKSPAEGRGNLMFSQRNNPYCDLLHFSMANILKISTLYNKYEEKILYLKKTNTIYHEKDTRIRFRRQ